MSAQDYWNNHPESSQQNNYSQPVHGQNHAQAAYPYGQEQDHSYQAHQPSGYGHSSDAQNRAYQSHQPSGYGHDSNEPLNWGYGAGGSAQAHQQYNQPLPGQSHYDTPGSNQHDTQQYSSYNHDQASNVNQGYGSQQIHPQAQHEPYHAYGNNSYSNPQIHQSQPYPSVGNTTDYNRQPSPNPYDTQSTLPYSYDNPAHAAAISHQVFPSNSTMPASGAAIGPDGERGLLGAIGGAAVGGYAGHKVNHGFLGAVGGAYAGHKLEDHLKDQRKKDKKDNKDKKHSSGRRGSHSSSSSSSSDDDKKKKKKDKYGTAAVMGADGAGAYAMHHQSSTGRAVPAGNFSASSTQISLDRDYDLIASCGTMAGTSRLSSISLNSCIANSWGQLVWARGGGFAASSRNVRLVDGGRILEADVGDGKGGWNLGRLRLDERITNQNGDLQFLE